MPDVRIRMAREPAGDSQREPQVSVVPWGKGTLSRQGQQRPRVKEAGRRQAARPRAERRPVPEGLHAHAGAMVWWRGPCGHVWREKVSMRSMHVDDSCPYCKNRKLLRGFNDLATAYPELAAEWDFERNGDLRPTDVIASSSKRVWWKCKEGHERSGLIANRARKGKADPGCPYCSGRKVLAGFNDLAATHPGIAACGTRA